MAKSEKEPGMGKKDNTTNAIKNRQKRQAGFLQSLEGGVSVLKASKAAGIDYKTIWRWRKENEEFNTEVTSILDSRIMIVEDALFLNAAKGNLGAQIFWLKNRSGGRWKDKTESEIDVTHKGLNYDEFQNFKRMTENERATFITKLSAVIGSENAGKVRRSQEGNKERSMAIKKDNIPKL